jgi:hypothetical protein
VGSEYAQLGSVCGKGRFNCIDFLLQDLSGFVQTLGSFVHVMTLLSTLDRVKRVLLGSRQPAQDAANVRLGATNHRRDLPLL